MTSTEQCRESEIGFDLVGVAGEVTIIDQYWEGGSFIGGRLVCTSKGFTIPAGRHQRAGLWARGWPAPWRFYPQ